MKWLLLSVCVLAGCAGPLYYHERADGTRYYQTDTEQVVRVDKDGWVTETPAMYRGAYRTRLKKKGDDWDLTGYGIVPPTGHCRQPLNRYAESCLNRVWEPVALVLMAPILNLPGVPLLGDSVPPGWRTPGSE